MSGGSTRGLPHSTAWAQSLLCEWTLGVPRPLSEARHAGVSHLEILDSFTSAFVWVFK